MVNTIQFYRFVFACFILMGALIRPAWSDSLEASVDRTSISENESVQLSVTGSMEVNFNFNIFNLSLPSPDLAPLQQDFEILEQRQRYNFQNINGQNHASITWTYSLVPKRTGTLTIPALKFKDAQSEPIQIEVTTQKPGSATRDNIFLEAEISKTESYVQEQLIYTLRLNYLDNIVSGDLTEPELNNAIIKQIDKQKEYSRVVDGRRYDVIERRYAIFPQTSGKLEITPQMFTGTLYDSRLRDRRYAKASSDAVEVNVLPPPNGKQGGAWLPAMSLSLTEQWSRTPDQLDIGDSVTRTITVKALGLEGSQLPPLSSQEHPQFKQYPEQPQLETETHQEGVTGTRVERIAMVAMKPGEITLPEVRLPWWDTLNNEWREAVIPARKIRIAGSVAAPQSGTVEPQPETSAQDSQVSQLPEMEKPIADVSPQGESRFWQGVSLVLLAAWLATLGLLVLLRRRKSGGTVPPSADATSETARQEEAAYRHLIGLSDQDWNQVRPALLAWAKLHWPRHSIHSLSDLMEHAQSPTLTKNIQELEAARYSSHKPSSSHKSSGTNTGAIISEVQRIQALRSTPAPGDHNLAELYPSSR